MTTTTFGPRPPLDPKALLITAGTPVPGRPVLYVDVEATGFAATARIIEIAIVDWDGHVLLNTLVNPRMPIPWAVTRLTGITNAMVQHAPTWDVLRARVTQWFTGNEVVAHNAVFERSRLLLELQQVGALTCTLKMARQRCGEPMKLSDAALQADYTFVGPAHRALPDTLAGRAVHQWLLTRPDPLLVMADPVVRGRWAVRSGRRVWLTPGQS